MQRLRLERDEWACEAHEREAEIAKLKEGLKEPSDLLVREISVVIDHEDEVVKLQLKKELRPMLSKYLGRQVRDLDPVFVYSSLHGKAFKLDNQTFILEVKAAILAETTVILIKACRV